MIFINWNADVEEIGLEIGVEINLKLGIKDRYGTEKRLLGNSIAGKAERLRIISCTCVFSVNNKH